MTNPISKDIDRLLKNPSKISAKMLLKSNREKVVQRIATKYKMDDAKMIIEITYPTD